MKSLVSRFAKLCLVLVMIGTPIAASAQQQYKAEVLKQLRIVEAAVVLKLGYALQPSHDVFYVNLRNNTYQDVRYELDAGNTYVFIGACDFDCSGLQLKLYDGYWDLVSTSEQGYLPFVSTTVGTSGSFHLRITMHGCQIEPCWAGIGAYR